jgi:hypothetical protein
MLQIGPFCTRQLKSAERKRVCRSAVIGRARSTSFNTNRNEAAIPNLGRSDFGKARDRRSAAPSVY